VGDFEELSDLCVVPAVGRGEDGAEAEIAAAAGEDDVLDRGVEGARDAFGVADEEITGVVLKLRERSSVERTTSCICFGSLSISEGSSRYCLPYSV
jgi:hypothetical protein